MFPFHRIVAGLAVVIISAGIGVASEKLGGGPSDTPVAYYICDKDGNGCQVHARFKALDACDKYRDRQRWGCVDGGPLRNGYGSVKCMTPPPGEKEVGAVTRCVK